MKDGSGRYLCREGQLGIWTDINKTKRTKSGSLGSARFGIHELWQLLGQGRSGGREDTFLRREEM